MSKTLSDIERQHDFVETLVYWREKEDPSECENEGEVRKPPITAGEERTATNTSGEERTATITAVKEKTATNTSGEESKPPITAGEESKPPITEGEESEPPITAGEERTATNTSGEERTATITALKERTATNTSGEESKPPITAGEERTATMTSGEERTATSTAGEESEPPITAGEESPLLIAGEVRKPPITAGEERTATITAGEASSLPFTSGEEGSPAITAGKESELRITAGEEKTATITSGEESTETITAGEESEPPITAGEERTATITAGEERTATITAGEERTATITAGEESPATITSGGESSLPFTSGEERTPPITAGEESTQPITAGEESAPPITAGEENAPSITAGEESPATITSGETSSLRFTSGEECSPAITAGDERPTLITAGDESPATITVDEESPPLISAEEKHQIHSDVNVNVYEQDQYLDETDYDSSNNNVYADVCEFSQKEHLTVKENDNSLSLIEQTTSHDDGEQNVLSDAETADDVAQLLRTEEDESSCNKDDLTVDVTGITGGKAGKVTAIGTEEISRNNKSTFEDSTFKVSSNGSRNSKKIKGEGMTDGEADEVEVVGRRTVSEGNELTVERSKVDVSGAEQNESSCNKDDLTVEQVDVTGITGGKAGKVTAVGLEEISRNNKSTFEDSTFKVKTHGSSNNKKIKGEGMTGGEADEVEVVGRRRVSEGNQLTVKGSDVDVSGHAGTALAGLSGQILNSTIIVHGGQTSGSGGNLLGQINASGVSLGTVTQGQNVDITETTGGEGSDIEVTRKKMALKGGMTGAAAGKLEVIGEENKVTLEDSGSRVSPKDNGSQETKAVRMMGREAGDVENTGQRAVPEDLSDSDGYKMEIPERKGERRIAVIGLSGSGKSFTANTLLGRRGFLHESLDRPLTKITSLEKTEHNKCVYRIIDTPGLWSGKNWTKTRRDEFLRCLTLGAPGLHVFLLVIKIRDSVFNEKYVIEALVQILGKNIERFLIVVFTSEDHLEQNNLTLEEYIQTRPSELKTLLERCNNRFIAINNRGHPLMKRQAREKLLSLIKEVVESNEGAFYTRAMFEDHIKQQKTECILS